MHQTPIVTVDIVIFSIIEGTLHYLLTSRDQDPFKGEFALPGGWVYLDADTCLEDAAYRILKSKVGIDCPYFEQLMTFSGATRDPRGWSVSVAYFAIVRDHSAISSGKWVPADILNNLPFDHKDIVNFAVNRVRSKSAYSSLASYFLPDQFTWTKMQEVYEQVLGGSLDKRTFRRRIEELDILTKVGVFSANHRPASLFTLKQDASLVLNDRIQRIKETS